MNPRTKRLTAWRKMKRLIGATPRYAVLLVCMAHVGALAAETPQQQAWDILRAGVNQKSTGKRTQAVRALRLLPDNPEATKMAQTALQDRKPEVRAAPATALGLMGPKQPTPQLQNTPSYKKPAYTTAPP